MGSIHTIWHDICSLKSLLTGLKITGRHFFRPQVTVHYPRESVTNLDTFRGPLELKPDPAHPTRPLCIACMTCVSTCPCHCIRVVKNKEAATAAPPKSADVEKKALKGPSIFQYDYSLCCLCGLCVENCPKGAIRFSNRAVMAGSHRDAFRFDLLAQLQDSPDGEYVADIPSVCNKAD